MYVKVLIFSRNFFAYVFVLGVVFTCALFAFLSAPTPAHAATGVNQQINFQGRLLNSQGATVADGFYNIQFKMYQDGNGCVGSGSSPCGGTLKWTETYLNNNSQGVQVKNGFLSVNLGSVNPFGSSIDWNQDTLWLSMNIGDTNTTCTPFGSCTPDGEMIPFKRLSSTPYSLNSGQLGGLTSSQFVQVGQGVQGDATNNSSIFINKTGTGNLLELKTSGNSALTVTNAGDVTFGASANHTLSVTTAAAGVAGKSLTVAAGNAGTGSAVNGGDLLLQAGAASGTGTTGSVIVRSNAADSTGAFQIQKANNAVVFNVNTSTSSVQVASLIDTTTATTLAVGTTNATAISLDKNTTVSGSNTFTVGTGLTSLGGGLNVSAGPVDVTSSVAFKKGTDYSTTGTTNDVNLGEASLIRLTGASTQIITGVANGRDGEILTIMNAAGQQASIANNNSGSLAVNRIITGTSVDVALPAGASLTMIYDGGASLWRVTSGVASTGGSGVNTVGAIDTQTKAANGAVIVGTTVYFQTADATSVGMVSTGTQTLAGAKTFSSLLTGSAGATFTGGALTMTGNAASSLTTSSGALTLTSAAAATWSTGAGNLTLQAGSGTVSLGSSTILTSGGALTVTGGSTLTLNSTGTNNVSLDTGGAAAINIGAANATTIQVGSTTNSSGTQAINIGTNNTSGSTTNVTIGSGASATAGTTAIQSKNNTTFTTNGVVRGTFDTSNNLFLGNGTTAATPNNFAVQATGSATTGTVGATITVQGGAGASASTGSGGGGVSITGGAAGGSGNNNGGTVTVQGGTATGSGTSGSVVVKSNTTNSTTAFLVQNAIGSNAILADTTPLNTTIDGGNGSFEGTVTTGTPGWALKAGSGTVARDITQAYTGSASLKIALTSNAIGDGVKYTPSSFATGSYSLSFFIKQTAGDAFASNLAFGYNNGADNNCTPVPTLSSQPVSTLGWVRYSCTFTATGTPAYIYWKETDAPTVARTFFIDGVQLESGGTANAFTDSRLQLNGVITQPTAFQNTNDSVAALTVQNASGSTRLLTVDTLNSRVLIGSANLPATATTAFIQSNNTSSKALIVQGASGQATDILDVYSGAGAFVAGYDQNGNSFTNGFFQSGTTSAVGQLKLKDGTANNRSVTLDTAALSGSITLHLPDVATGSTICTTGTVCAGYQASSTAIIQGPTNTAQNTIAPTTNSVVALTVKGTTGTAANVLEVFDSTATPVRQAFFDNTGSLNVAKVIQPTSNNAIDVGVSGTAFRTGYFGTSVVTPLLDSSTGTLNVGTGNSTTTINVGSITLSSGTQAINIGTNNTAGGTTNVTIGTGSTATGGTTAIQSKNNTTFTTNGVVRGTFDTSNNFYFGNGVSVAAPNNFTVQGSGSLNAGTAGGNLTVRGGAGSSATTGSVGGDLTLEGGQSLGTGNKVGGNVLILGGAPTGTSASGSVIVRPQTNNSTAAFVVQTAAQAQMFVVDTSNNRVGINTSSTPSSTLEVNGTLRLSGTTTETYTTPGSASVSTKINIPNFDPGAFGQIMAMGIPSGANNTARVASFFDGRAVAHQPTLAVFSPDESNIIGLSWNGASTTGYLMTTDATTGGSTTAIAMRSGAVSGGSGNSGAVTVQSGDIAGGSGNTTGAVTIQSGNGGGTNASSGGVTIDSGTKTGTGTNGSVSVGATNASGVTVGNTSGAASLLLQSGTGNIALNVAGTVRATVDNANSIYFGNGVTAAAPNDFTLRATGSSTTGVRGGILALQGGNATVGNANGGNVTITGGTGFGTGVSGLVVISTPTFQTTANDANCYTSGALVASSCSITANSVNNSSAVIVGFSTSGQTATLPDPTTLTAGRVIYVTAANGSQDFTLSVNGGGTGNSIAMRQNTTATMIWNGADWTAAGASSSTTLQSAYDNTLQSAGGAELIVSKTAATNGLTLRDSTANPVNGTLLSVQTQSAGGLFSVNSGVTEYASNGGAETAGGTSTTFPANTWSAAGSATVSRFTTAGNFIATGQGSVSTATTTAANDGVKNRLSTTLTANNHYNVSFTTRLSSGTFTDMNVYYSIDGTAASVACTTTQAVNTSVWTKVNCAFTAPSSGITSSNSIFIRQTGSGTARTFYVDNLSVTIAADYNYATDGSVDDNTNFATNWSAVGATVTRSTGVGNDASDSAQVVTTTSNQGVRNKLSINPLTSTLYRITAYSASTTSGFNTFTVRYSRDGGTNFVSCADYNTQAISSSTTSFTKVTCYITTDSTAPSNPYLYFTQTDATGRTWYVDTLSMTLSSNTAPNVQIGGGINGGPVTLFTLDRGASAPIASDNDALLGSMYYDTTLGKLQCYEADGWGACGSSPDNIITISPEYTNAVMHGTGVGTMTSDICSDALNVNDGSSGQSTICGTNETYNFYKWTSPQASAQTYSIYVTYQLPSTFKSFSSGQTSLMGRTDSTNSTVNYQVYRNNTASGLSACGSTVSVSTGSVASWQTGIATGAADPSTCGFAGGDSIVFKINVTASSNANAYVGNLNFTFSNR